MAVVRARIPAHAPALSCKCHCDRRVAATSVDQSLHVGAKTKYTAWLYTSGCLARPSTATRLTWADATTAHGRLMLTVLGGSAEFERELIRTRTGEGRERAKARGVMPG